ncbi:MAG: ATP-binding cassette domain-containing protein [Lachnospiraceae bacterium]|jgi:energy-coupling factor transporter ATP-binding protein EcfA2|nr:ATP-binding cassette domain-containing protein [Lachnospiraceae bacterium]MEE3461191.1 ATP-binding cassette domain-containing protein [Lachnospiraceae bacterium]
MDKNRIHDKQYNISVMDEKVNLKDADIRGAYFNDKHFRDTAINDGHFSGTDMYDDHTPLLKFDRVSFRYPGTGKQAIEDISFTVEPQEFVVICGQSGCGKSTLLAHMKKNQIPFGKGSGQMYFKGTPIEELADRESAAEIGFVRQDFEGQTVADKVYHELAFGLESIGVPLVEMRKRIAETALYFGLEKNFRRETDTLSGGEKQLLALCSVMVMRPELLVLDEPTNQLDPAAAESFINSIVRINREFSTTIVISEQRLGLVLPYADKVIMMHQGRIFKVVRPDQIPQAVYDFKEKFGIEYPAASALPVATQIYIGTHEASAKGAVKNIENHQSDKSIDNAVEGNGSCYYQDPESCGSAGTGNVSGRHHDNKVPLTVRDGREYIRRITENKALHGRANEDKAAVSVSSPILTASDIEYSYSSAEPVLRSVSLKVPEKSVFSILGGNGSGKTTLLKVLAGIYKPVRGKVRCKYKNAYLSQDPLAIFTEISVEDELAESLKPYEKDDKTYTDEEIRQKVNEMLIKLKLNPLRKMHPYDLSGGEAQRLAIGKILLRDPDLLLLDEPSKGLDASFKKELSEVLQQLKGDGKTIIMVSHDLDFVAENSDYSALLFDGEIQMVSDTASFFKGNLYLSTDARRICHDYLPDVITTGQAVEAVNALMVSI